MDMDGWMRIGVELLAWPGLGQGSRADWLWLGDGTSLSRLRRSTDRDEPIKTKQASRRRQNH